MSGRRVGLGLPVIAALILAPALNLAPPLAASVAAADTLREAASATYAADPAEGVVHVTVVESATNLKPDTISGGVRRQFFYDELLLPIHSEATAVAASDSRGSLKVTREKKSGYDLVTVRLRSSLFFRQTTKVTLRYELPSGAPRSASEIRVGQAFVGLYLYAWGDPGQGSVRVELPAGFEPEVSGDKLDQSSGGDTVVLSTSGIAQPFEWFAVVSANRDSKLAVTPIALGNGDSISIRAWPEDREWGTRVADVLRTGTPVLRELVGLDWPVHGDLVVTEVQSAALEGYAGIYDSFSDTILITEDLDELTIVHEASHAWFNDELFDARWITEGLADGYASLVLDRVHVGTYDPPTRPNARAPEAVKLNDWVFPGRIADDETAAREDYGYNASWFVVRSLIDEVGDAKMRSVLRAAEDNEIAYLGDGPPEMVVKRDTWRRFLDLLEERGSSTQAEDLFRAYVLNDRDLANLEGRATARAAYAELARTAADVGDGTAGWVPPLVVRQAMSEWRFSDADRSMKEATGILAAEADLETEARVLDLTMPGHVAAAWRRATADFAATHVAVTETDAALADLAQARTALDAHRDVLVTIGLAGARPDDDWTAAAAAFEADDFEAADVATNDLEALLARAPETGRIRVAGGAAVLGGFVLGGVVIARRRRRPKPAAVAEAGAEPSATLPAEPAPASDASAEPSAEHPTEPAPEP